MASVRKLYPKGHSKHDESPWVVEYSDVHGKRHRHTPRPNSKAAADKIARKIEKNVYLSNNFMPYTVKDICMNYLRIVERRYNDNDRMSRMHMKKQWDYVDKYIVPGLGPIRAADLSPMQIDNWVSNLRMRRQKPVSVMTIRGILGTLRMALTEAQRLEIVKRNILKDIPPRLPSANRKPIAVPSQTDLDGYLKISEGRISLIIKLAIFTGMRLGEIRALMWPQVDFEKAIISVKHSAEADGTIKSPKTKAGNRDIPISKSLVAALREWKIGNTTNPHEMVFPGQMKWDYRKKKYDLRVISPGSIQLDWKRVQKASGAKSLVNFHSLRHAAASLYIQTGLTPQRLKVLMGHASITMTFDTYGYLFPEDGAARRATHEIEDQFMGRL